jgi:hypothetical protein
MSQYRKKPVVIDAWQFTSRADLLKSPDWLRSVVSTAAREPRVGEVIAFDSPIDTEELLAIGTLEGRMIAGVGDFIIRGVKGEIYSCKPDIFEMTYEAVSP